MKKIDLSNENIGKMSKSDLRCCLVDMRIERDRLKLQKEIYEMCGKLIYINHLQAVKDLAQTLVETYTEDDYKDIVPCWEEVQDNG
jgi:hypothetical protein